MAKKLKALPNFSSWEEEDAFWATHSITDLDLEEDTTPLIVSPEALRKTQVITVRNPTSLRLWKRKAA